MPRLRIELDELTAAFCRLLRHRHLLSPTGSNITIMSRRAYLDFGDIEGKLDVLLVECTKCARKGRYSVRRLIEKYGWPAPGSEDTELGVLMEPEVGHGET